MLQALESWGRFPSISIANPVGIAALAGIALRGQATDSEVQISPCFLASDLGKTFLPAERPCGVSYTRQHHSMDCRT